MISMYRSSGISGARPVSCLSVSRDQAEASRQTSRYGPRHQELDILGLENYCACSLGGMVHSVPADLRIRRILLPARALCLASCLARRNFSSFGDLPVTILTWAIPWESRRMTPICEGVAPFCTPKLSQNRSHSITDKTFRRTLERRTMDSSTDSAEVLSHDGMLRE